MIPGWERHSPFVTFRPMLMIGQARHSLLFAKRSLSGFAAAPTVVHRPVVGKVNFWPSQMLTQCGIGHLTTTTLAGEEEGQGTYSLTPPRFH